MAQKLNLDFSIGESIVKGFKLPDVVKSSVYINTTNVPLVGGIKTVLSTSDETVDIVNNDVDLVKQNYESALNTFKDIQYKFKDKTIYDEKKGE